jgi:hypothetical protein
MRPRADLLWLEPIQPDLRDQAVAALEDGDVLAFLNCADNTAGLYLVDRNAAQLRARELYEAALLAALTDTRTNNHEWSMRALRQLVERADRARLRACGDPLPGPGPFTLYRGVAGTGAARRVRGLSWTNDLAKARWFANRAQLVGLVDPAVVRTTVAEPDVLACTNDRKEREFIVLLPARTRVVRVPAGACGLAGAAEDDE